MEEIWKDIEGYEGKYTISNYGKVTALNFAKRGFSQELKQSLDSKGYSFVNLYFSGKMNPHRIHRLIAIHFIPNPESKPYINHINGIKNDNSIDNLEWCTAKENIRHSFDTGLNKNSDKQKQSIRNISSKKVINNNDGMIHSSCVEASKYYKIEYQRLKSMLNGSRKNKTSLKYL